MADLNKQLEGYRRLIEVSRNLASTLDLDILLNRIIRASADITEAEEASILLYDDTARQLCFQVATNLAQPLMRGIVVPLDGSIAGWIITHRQPVRITNAQNDPRYYSDIEKITQVATRSLLGVPLTTKDKVIGVLEVINKSNGNFTKTDEDLLLVLGAQAAITIENARLFQQSDLIAEFVHELRTPLASIGTATYLLLRPEMSHEQREQTIHSIHNETLRLNDLASSFLDLARLESGRVQYQSEEFTLRPLLEECINITRAKADENRIDVIMEVAEDFPQVVADRDKIKQLVLNLLSNAIKYNSPKGRVILRMDHNENEWTLTVQDTGIGIPEDALPELFQKFYRVRGMEGKVAGTGLGLSICKQIVSGHGGRIEVRSKLGKGTTFIVHMPRK